MPETAFPHQPVHTLLICIIGLQQVQNSGDNRQPSLFIENASENVEEATYNHTTMKEDHQQRDPGEGQAGPRPAWRRFADGAAIPRTGLPLDEDDDFAVPYRPSTRSGENLPNSFAAVILT